MKYCTISQLFSDLQVWQIKEKKLINKGTGQEYSHDTSKQGYDLGGVIVNYLKTAQDKWKFCQEDDETFKIKCTISGSFLRANSQHDAGINISGNLSLLPKIQNHTQSELD